MSSDELKLPLPSLADYVHFHRKRLGLTREALGQRAFLSVRTIQKLERGEQTGLSGPTQEALGRALGLTTPHTDSGPVSVTMQLQSFPPGRDFLHLCIGVVRPYSGPPLRTDPI